MLSAAMDMITVVIIGRVRPKFLPSAPRHSWSERLAGLRLRDDLLVLLGA